MFSYHSDEALDEGFSEKVKSLAEGASLPDWAEKVASSQYALVCSFEHEGRKYLFKRFLKRDIFEPLKAVLFGSRSHRALNSGKSSVRTAST